ncbi:MAG: hypothetical protein U0271_47205 [Polyangiaceae bacterium]
MSIERRIVFSALLGLASAGAGCASTPEKAFNSPVQKTDVKRLPDGSIDDQSKCEWRGRQDREAIETAGPGSVTPNVRRVFAIVGQGQDRQRVLVCREIDTNLDGTKDVVRRYNDKGEPLFEEADINYDGRVDTWLVFSKGHITEEKLDTNFDGNPDEWKYYANGKIVRAKRDTNNDSKPDIWEMYAADGTLERMGVDVDGDERVDRWDYDTDVRRAHEAKERAAEEEEARKAAEKAEAERKAAEYQVADDDDAADPKPKKKERKPAAKKAQEEAAKKEQAKKNPDE